MTNLSPYLIHEPVVPYQYHIKGPLQLISNQKILQQICVHCCFERLSILGQFPAFLLHTSVHKALSITVPGFPLCEALYLSFLWSSLPNCERAWLRTVTYRAQLLTTARSLFVDHHARIGTVTYQSHWEAKTKLGHQETIVLGCCTVPAYYNYSSLFYIQEISISICFVPQGAGRAGVGQIGPRFAARVKNSPKNSRLLGLLALTIDRFLTSVGFYTVCRVNMEFHQVHRPTTNIFTDFLYKIIILKFVSPCIENTKTDKSAKTQHCKKRL